MNIVALKPLRGHPHIYRFIGWGRTDKLNYSYLSLRGKYLPELSRSNTVNSSRGAFSLTKTTKCGQQTPRTIKSIHSDGFLHKDIELANFAMGRQPANARASFALNSRLTRQYISTVAIGSKRPEVGYSSSLRNYVTATSSSPSFVDFAPDSPEARVSDATTHLGLSLMKAMPSSITSARRTTTSAVGQSQQHGNTVLSPLSLQILLNMILLGTKDQSLSQAELAKVLGYSRKTSGAGELSLKAGESEDDNSTRARLSRPHEAMHSVVGSIMKATRSPANDETSNDRSSQYSRWRHYKARLRAMTRLSPFESQVSFTIANLMLTNKDLVEINPEYENELKRYYDTRTEQFSRQEDSRNEKNLIRRFQPKLHERVNNWVENVTKNKITNLADESLSSELLILVLVNAAHFKGRWLHPFKSIFNKNRIFHNNGQTSVGVKTKFMCQTKRFGYADFDCEEEQQALGGGLSEGERQRLELTANISCRALSLPFSLNHGQEMSMVVLLPSQRDGLDKLIENLNVEVLNEIYRSLSNEKVEVELPKFNIEASYDIRAMLTELGLEHIFGDTAELDRMFAAAPKLPPQVNKIIHKAKIIVDEQGAEAAAASMAGFGTASRFEKVPPIFIADHPFLYIIRHNRSNMPLFMGQVRNF